MYTAFKLDCVQLELYWHSNVHYIAHGAAIRTMYSTIYRYQPCMGVLW